jgi:saccharopine dehydrogenase-like NADP-dependent oxidoreductase
VTSVKELDEAVSAHDLIISLIPYTFHVAVIKSAIKFKRNVVTTSYVSDAIQALEPEYLTQFMIS